MGGENIFFQSEKRSHLTNLGQMGSPSDTLRTL